MKPGCPTVFSLMNQPLSLSPIEQSYERCVISGEVCNACSKKLQLHSLGGMVGIKC